MNILFLSLLSFESLQERILYTDLLREFAKNGHHVYAISPAEKKQNIKTHLIYEENATILRLKIGNIQKTGIIEKGISTVMIEPTFKKAIRVYFSEVKFDLVLYSTPPITLVSAIEYVKERDGASTYLLLKDIFPQNAVDIGLMSMSGLKGLLYKHFRNQEKRLYGISDHIGCMSQANVAYVIDHNPEIDPAIVEVCPNCIDVVDKSVNDKVRKEIRAKYGIPDEKKVFVYGGNLGKPQGIAFLVDCLKRCSDLEGAFVLIVGDGTEYHLISQYIENEKPTHVKLMKRLSKEDYDTMVGACDVGMIFLDHRFTIPNVPSRLLAYMQAKLPVIAVTDTHTDIGTTITENGFGWWCESNDTEKVYQCIQESLTKDLMTMGENGFAKLSTDYSTETSYKIIYKHYKEKKDE